MSLIFVLFWFCLGVTPSDALDYSWICTSELLLIVFGEPSRKSKIKSGFGHIQVHIQVHIQALPVLLFLQTQRLLLKVQNQTNLRILIYIIKK